MVDIFIAVHARYGATGAAGDQARGVPHPEGRHHRQLRRPQRGGAGGALETEGVPALLALRLRRRDEVRIARRHVIIPNYQTISVDAHFLIKQKISKNH